MCETHGVCVNVSQVRSVRARGNLAEELRRTNRENGTDEVARGAHPMHDETAPPFPLLCTWEQHASKSLYFGAPVRGCIRNHFSFGCIRIGFVGRTTTFYQPLPSWMRI